MSNGGCGGKDNRRWLFPGGGWLGVSSKSVIMPGSEFGFQFVNVGSNRLRNRTCCIKSWSRSSGKLGMELWVKGRSEDHVEKRVNVVLSFLEMVTISKDIGDIAEGGINGTFDRMDMITVGERAAETISSGGETAVGKDEI